MKSYVLFAILASLTQHNAFEVHQCFCIDQEFIPFYFWVVFHSKKSKLCLSILLLMERLFLVRGYIVLRCFQVGPSMKELLWTCLTLWEISKPTSKVVTDIYICTTNISVRGEKSNMISRFRALTRREMDLAFTYL